MISFCSDAVLFTETDVHRTSSVTPSNVAGNSIDYSFYVNYPNQNVPIVGNILASIVKYELLRMHSESALFFSLETSFSPYAPTPPTSAQSSNTVEIRIFNQSSTEVCNFYNVCPRLNVYHILLHTRVYFVPFFLRTYCINSDNDNFCSIDFFQFPCSGRLLKTTDSEMQ